MKQTNSAITMLLGSFRSIFKRAYVKGIASAVVLTAGLSAGAANAADIVSNAGDLSSSGADTALTIVENSRAESITITAKGTLTGDAANDKLYVADAITVSDSGVISISSGAVVRGYNGTTSEGLPSDVDTTGYTAALTMNGANTTLKLASGGALQMNSVALTGTTVSIAGAKSDKTSWNTEYAQLTGNSITLDNAKVTLGAKSLVQTKGVLNVNGADTLITMEGTGTESGGKESASGGAIINGTADSHLNFNDGTINVAKGKYGEIHSPDINLNGTDINVSGALTLSGQLRKAEGFGNLTADVDMNAGTITVAKGGTLTVNGTFDVQDDGSLINSGTVTLNKNADLSDIHTLRNEGTIKISGYTTTVGSAEDLGVYGENAKGKVEVASGASLVISSNTTLGENVFQDHQQADKVPYIKNSGSVVVQGDLTITQDSSEGADKFNVIAFETKDASLTVNNLTVEQNEYVDSGNTKIAQFVLQSGTLNILGNVTGEGGYLAVRGEVHDDAVLNLGTAGVSSSLNDIARVVVGDGDDQNSSLNVIGNYDFGGAGLVVSSSGSAVIEGSVSNSERLQVKAGGELTVNGSASFDRLLAGSGESGSVNVAGTLTIEGDGNTAEDSSVDVKLSGNTYYTINNGGNFVISAGDAADDVVNASGSVISDNWDKSKLTINAGGKLTVDLSGKTFESDDLKSLKENLVDTNNNGTISFGNISLSDSDDFLTEDGEVDYNEVVSGGMAGIEVGSWSDKAAVVDSTNASKMNSSLGSVKAVAGSSIGVNGALTLNNAASNGNNFATVGDSDEAADIAVGAGSVLTLNNAGNAGNLSSANNTGIVNLNANEGTQNVGNIKVAEANVNTGTVNAVSVDVGELTTAAGSTLTVGEGSGSVTIGTTGGTIAGTLNAGAVLASGNLTVGGLADVDTITLADSNNLDVTGVVVADSITLGSGTGGTLSVGDNESSGRVEVKTLNLNGGKLLIDPAWTDEASFVAVTGGVDKPDVIEIGGSVGVGQNSVGVFGADRAEAQESLARLGLLTDHKLSESGIGAVMYLGETLEVAYKADILLDKTKDNDGLDTEISGMTANSGSVTLRDGSALVIAEDFANELVNNNNETIFHFAATTGTMTVDVDAGAEIIFDSTDILGGDTVKIADASGGTVSFDIDGTITAANGLLVGSNQGATDTITFTLNEDEADALLNNQSRPVKDMTKRVVGNADDSYSTEDDGVSYIVAVNAHNGGADIEQTARLAAYAGAVQATYMAQQTSTEAVADRLSNANPNSSLIFADNAVGGGIWLSPVYKNHDSDSFDAEGVDAGADIDLYGVALGADFTTDSGVRVGAYFNVGSGDADGQGVGSDVSNDFDYYGMGLYAGMSFDGFGLIADAGFTQVSNDIEQSVNYHGIGKVTADTDTQAVTVGIRGEYKFDIDVMTVTPHVGLRYTNLDMDSYDAKVDGYVVATTDADNMQIFSIPFGVTVSGDIQAGAWTLQPMFDITLTANTGDTEIDMDTTFVGVESLSLSTEVLDDFTYGGTLGFAAKYAESLSLGLGVSYVGSDNADEFGVVGNIRYMF